MRYWIQFSAPLQTHLSVLKRWNFCWNSRRQGGIWSSGWKIRAGYKFNIELSAKLSSCLKSWKPNWDLSFAGSSNSLFCDSVLQLSEGEACFHQSLWVPVWKLIYLDLHAASRVWFYNFWDLNRRSQVPARDAHSPHYMRRYPCQTSHSISVQYNWYRRVAHLQPSTSDSYEASSLWSRKVPLNNYHICWAETEQPPLTIVLPDYKKWSLICNEPKQDWFKVHTCPLSTHISMIRCKPPGGVVPLS